MGYSQSDFPNIVWCCFRSRKVEYDITSSKIDSATLPPPSITITIRNFTDPSVENNEKILDLYGGFDFILPDTYWYTRNDNSQLPLNQYTYFVESITIGMSFVAIENGDSWKFIPEAAEMGSFLINGKNVSLASAVSTSNDLPGADPFIRYAKNYYFIQNNQQSLIPISISGNNLSTNLILNKDVIPYTPGIYGERYIYIINLKGYLNVSTQCKKSTKKGIISKNAYLQWIEIMIYNSTISIYITNWYKLFLDLIDLSNLMTNAIIDGVDFLNLLPNNMLNTYSQLQIGRDLIVRIAYDKECESPTVNIYCGGKTCPADFCVINCGGVECCYDPQTGELIGGQSPRVTKNLNGVTVNFY